MSLLPEDAGYLEHVQAYFLAFRGDGVALSPLDAALLFEWQQRGIPPQIVCRGIRKAAESLLRDAREGARLRTLRSCRTAVEREFRRYEGLSAGRGAAVEAATEPQSFAGERIRKARSALVKALKASPTEAHRRGLEAALALLEGDCDDPREAARRIARADDALALLFARGLPYAERRPLVAEARRLAGPRPEGASPRARKDALRAHLVALARTRGALVALG